MHRIAHDEMRRNHDSGVFRVEREGAFYLLIHCESMYFLNSSVYFL